MLFGLYLAYSNCNRASCDEIFLLEFWEVNLTARPRDEIINNSSDLLDVAVSIRNTKGIKYSIFFVHNLVLPLLLPHYYYVAENI